MKNIKANEFAQFLVEQTPKFDEMILEDIRPTDSWLLNVSTGPGQLDWWYTREMVRKISEGVAFKPSKPIAMGSPVELTQDRFRAVWPKTTKEWKKVEKHHLIPDPKGLPSDK